MSKTPKEHTPLLPYLEAGRTEAGCDEAGRGCLAGPVVAAAVILPPNFSNDLLNDSKQLTEKQRETLRPIIEKEALSWAVAEVSNTEIDQINILNASIKAMHKALDQLTIRPDFIIVDGNKFKPYTAPDNTPIAHQTIVKGDGKYMAIAAASVLAKTHRDELMSKLDKLHPEYDWKTNKGYPTQKHRDAVKQYGQTELHRLTFDTDKKKPTPTKTPRRRSKKTFSDNENTLFPLE